MSRRVKKTASAPTYGFRLKFALPAGITFAGVHPRRRLQIASVPGRVYLVQLPQQKRNRFGARTRHAIVGKGFPTHASAQDAGSRIQHAMSLFTVERRIGLDAQNRRGTSFSQAIKDMMAAEHNVQLRDDLHGLDVYLEDKPVTRITTEAYASTKNKIEDYEGRLLAFFQASPKLNAKQRLAVDLYNLSHFDDSAKTRFLTLITIVEVLSARRSRSAAARALVKVFRARAKAADMSPAELRSLDNGLGNLVRQSIGEACREFVGLHASGDDVAYFENCYKARSELVHAGETDRPEANDPTKLDQLVSHLLIRALGNDG